MEHLMVSVGSEVKYVDDGGITRRGTVKSLTLGHKGIKAFVSHPSGSECGIYLSDLSINEGVKKPAPIKPNYIQIKVDDIVYCILAENIPKMVIKLLANHSKNTLMLHSDFVYNHKTLHVLKFRATSQEVSEAILKHLTKKMVTYTQEEVDVISNIVGNSYEL